MIAQTADRAAAPTIAASLREATRALAPVSDSARLDAELLMAHALGTDRAALLLRHQDQPVPPGFAPLLARRMAHEPVAYIVGRKPFWNFELMVSPAVLIPRADSETLIEAAIQAYGRDRSPARVLDLGTGSGALLLAALGHWPEARGTGIDASEAALAIAQTNAEALGLADRAKLIRRDWRESGWTGGLEGPFDLILANPPYIEQGAALGRDVADYEPASALFAGPEGLDDYRLILPELASLLARDGVAVLEIGASQRVAVTGLAESAGFNVACHQDLGGRDRVLVLRRH